jgi:hypothetical protein
MGVVGEAEDEPESKQSIDPRWRSTDPVVSYTHLKLVRANAPPPAMAAHSHGGARRKKVEEEGVGPCHRLHRLRADTRR